MNAYSTLTAKDLPNMAGVAQPDRTKGQINIQALRVDTRNHHDISYLYKELIEELTYWGFLPGTADNWRDATKVYHSEDSTMIVVELDKVVGEDLRILPACTLHIEYEISDQFDVPNSMRYWFKESIVVLNEG